MDASALARRLAVLPALAMRRAVLREALAAGPADEVARLCAELVRRGPDGAPYDVALVALTAVLGAGELDYGRVTELYAAARRAGDESFSRLLLSARSESRPLDLPAVVIPGVSDATLGARKWLARGLRRDLLDRLLRDPDPAVIAVILGNPRVTEADVVRLAARRPTSPGTQRLIAGCERFIARYPVKRALVLNPYTPSDLAARLVVLLNRVDLARVAGDASLAAPVREEASEQLALLG